MSSFRRHALLLALGLAAITAAPAQSSSPSNSPAASAPDQSQGQMSVQARIKARRAQRRAAALHEAYAHRYEAYTGMSYLRFIPGPGYPANPASPGWPHGPVLQHTTEYAWDVGFTRYFNERLGVTVDGRGYFGTTFVGIQRQNLGITNPAVSQYAGLAGPTYRFYMQPKYSISGRVLGGVEYGNFSGDTNHSTILSTQLGLWPNGYTFAASASVVGEYNLTPHVGVSVAPEYYFTGFGSTIQSSRGFNAGIFYRLGKP
jgi:hypothetical protein